MAFQRADLKSASFQEASQVIDFEDFQLVRIDATQEFESIHGWLQEPENYDLAGLIKPPSNERTTEILVTNQTFLLWNAFEPGNAEPLAMAGLVCHSGEPYPIVIPMREMQFDAAQEIIMAVVSFFFAHSGAERMFFYVARPIHEEIHERLIDAGFDPIEELPTIDNEKEAAYEIQRETYVAYQEADQDEDI